ncbi:MAG: cysteine synthase family protein [Nitrospinae bacterium]|nr:cysteine synthase family protein [Nitrospinota bacterium]
MTPVKCEIKAEPIDKSLLKKIGNTPLLRIKNLLKNKPRVEIYAKAEWHNAGGSVKARPALNMIEEGEKSGALRPGKIILDSTSGNTGIAYALIGAIKGYEVHLVMPDNVCKQRKGLMAGGYHAKIITSDPLQSSDGAIRLCRETYNRNPELYFMPDQYNNPANWQAHYKTTAVEIHEQTNKRVTHFVAGIGTGGTVMGTGRGLKHFNPGILVYAVEPAEALHGLEGLKHMESSIVPGIYEESYLDGKLSVETEDAYEMVRRLEEEEGLRVGHSSGAAMAGALRLAGIIDEGVIVTVFPDSCDECYIARGEF